MLRETLTRLNVKKKKRRIQRKNAMNRAKWIAESITSRNPKYVHNTDVEENQYSNSDDKYEHYIQDCKIQLISFIRKVSFFK